jgi:DNA-binding NtrC family response regulator
MTPGLALVVDDDHDSADMLAAVLRLRCPGVETLVVYDARSALALAAARNPQVITLDLELPDGHGTALAAAIRKAMPDCSPFIIAISGHLGEVEDASSLGTFDVAFAKPLDIQKLLATIAAA